MRTSTIVVWIEVAGTQTFTLCVSHPWSLLRVYSEVCRVGDVIVHNHQQMG